MQPLGGDYTEDTRESDWYEPGKTLTFEIILSTRTFAQAGTHFRKKTLDDRSSSLVIRCDK